MMQCGVCGSLHVSRELWLAGEAAARDELRKTAERVPVRLRLLRSTC